MLEVYQGWIITMLDIYQVWIITANKMHLHPTVALKSACDEILEWKNTGTLRTGVVREFAVQLSKNGYSDSDCLTIAERYVNKLALEYVVNE